MSASIHRAPMATVRTQLDLSYANATEATNLQMMESLVRIETSASMVLMNVVTIVSTMMAGKHREWLNFDENVCGIFHVYHRFVQL